MPDVYERLSDLLAAAPRCVSSGGGLEQLAAAVRDLDEWARDDQDVDEPVDPLVELGQEAATTARRLGELQRLYRIRLEVTQEALENLRRAASP